MPRRRSAKRRSVRRTSKRRSARRSARRSWWRPWAFGEGMGGPERPRSWKIDWYPPSNVKRPQIGGNPWINDGRVDRQTIYQIEAARRRKEQREGRERTRGGRRM